MKSQKSVTLYRNCADRKAETEKPDKISQAAHVAPTAANLQPVYLIVIQENHRLEKIGKGTNIYGAPLAVIVCAVSMIKHGYGHLIINK